MNINPATAAAPAKQIAPAPTKNSAAMQSVFGSGVDSSFASKTANSIAAIDKKIAEYKKKISDLSSDYTSSQSEKAEQKQKYYDKINELQQQKVELQKAAHEQEAQAREVEQAHEKAAAEQGAGTSATAVGEKPQNVDKADFDFIIGLSNNKDNVSKMHKTRESIKGEINELEVQIKTDKARGADTTAKEEMKSNLSANLGVLERSIGGEIGKTVKLTDDKLKADEAEKAAEEKSDGEEDSDEKETIEE